MQLQLERTINCNRDTLWALFDNPDGKYLWHPTLRESTLLQGNFGKVGAVTRLRFAEVGPAAEMVETITAIAAPELFAATYATSLATNQVTNRFLALDSDQTQWVLTCELSFKGWARLVKKMALPMIEERLRADMARFQTVAEKGT